MYNRIPLILTFLCRSKNGEAESDEGQFYGTGRVAKVLHV